MVFNQERLSAMTNGRGNCTKQSPEHLHAIPATVPREKEDISDDVEVKGIIVHLSPRHFRVYVMLETLNTWELNIILHINPASHDELRPKQEQVKD